MASSTQQHLLSIIVLVLGLLSVSANARPCKTLFISSYSFSFKPSLSRPNPNLFLDRPNPNFFLDRPNTFGGGDGGSVTIFAEITRFNPRSSSSDIFIRRPSFLPVDEPQFHHHPRPVDGENPFPLFDSLRDRTKDVLSVVVALLFGVACGALTAATMYVAWSLFSNRFDYRSSYEEFVDDSEGDDDVSPKKMGYVKIPTATADAAMTVPKQVE